MARVKYRPEQVIPMLREVEVEIGKGMTVREVWRKLGFQENTYFHLLPSPLRYDESKQV